nr:hypothetical protein [uncultured bacterium]
MVDPSLLRLAADRGVTICFADLDGADGLWVPEERTVLVSRRLSEREVAAVIEHELEHAAIDDRHADLDAGVGRPPPGRPRRWAAGLTAAACLAVVGGVTAGLTRGPGGTLREDPVVAPSPPAITVPVPPPGPVVTVVQTVGPDGRPMVRTVTLTATAPVPTPAATSPAGSRSATPTVRATRRATAGPPPRASATAAPTSPSTSSLPSPTSPPPVPTVAPTTATPTPTETVVAGTDGSDAADDAPTGTVAGSTASGAATP